MASGVAHERRRSALRLSRGVWLMPLVVGCSPARYPVPPAVSPPPDAGHCYELVLTADSAHRVDMRGRPPDWVDRDPQRRVVDTVTLSARRQRRVVPDTRLAWQLGSTETPSSTNWWTERGDSLLLSTGNGFVLRTTMLAHGPTDGVLRGRTSEFTDASQSYFYTTEARRIACAG